jgi:hypothetical protein
MSARSESLPRAVWPERRCICRFAMVTRADEVIEYGRIESGRAPHPLRNTLKKISRQ